MTGASTLLAQLDRAGIVVWREGNRVRLRGRRPPPDLLAELHERKADLLAEISQRDQDAAEQDDDWMPTCRAIRDARLPLLGSPERDHLDREQARAVAGLLAGYRRHCGRAQ